MSALDELSAQLSGGAVIVDPDIVALLLVDPIAGGSGNALALVRPASVAEVAKTVQFAATAGLSVTVRGGGTGFCGGAVPEGGLLLDVSRLSSVRAIDTTSATVTVDAGLTLQALNAYLEDFGFTVPVRHGGIGSATVGGTLATNAGGSNVLAHGMTRAHVLGIEAVLADGTLWSGLRALQKDNSGYNLTQLLVGSEGTLGIITAATLRLSPNRSERAAALVGVASPTAALTLFTRLRDALAPLITASELMSHAALTVDAPLRAPWLMLVEVETPDAVDAQVLLAETLSASGAPDDTLIAKSVTDRAKFWAIRETLAAAQAADLRVLKSDTAVPVSQIATFIDAMAERIDAILPGAVPVPFGHLGDGNIHYNVRAPNGMDARAFAAHRTALAAAIAEQSVHLGGTLAAEHGIGRTKRDALAHTRPTDVALMHRLKHALDPQNTLNPGVVVSR